MRPLILLLLCLPLLAQKTTQPSNSSKWSDDGTTISPKNDRNVAIGTTCPGGAPAGSLCAVKLYSGGVEPSGGKRTLWGGAAAIVQAGTAATSFSLPAANAPTATADADGTQAYLVFTAATEQTAYARFELPSDWTGALNLVITANSTSGNAPTINAYTAAITAAGTTSNPTYGTATAVTMAPSGRTRVVTSLPVTAAKCVGGGGVGGACAATDALYLKLVITAAAAADLHVLSVQVTE